MKIAGTIVNFEFNSFEIYLSGCNKYCENCHNPELHSFDIGNDFLLEKTKLSELIHEGISFGLIRSIWVLGGEPLDNPLSDFVEFLEFLRSFNIPIMLWTHFEKDEIPEQVLDKIDYIKTGKHVPNSDSYTEPEFGITLSSKNQKIFKTG